MLNERILTVTRLWLDYSNEGYILYFGVFRKTGRSSAGSHKGSARWGEHKVEQWYVGKRVDGGDEYIILRSYVPFECLRSG